MNELAARVARKADAVVRSLIDHVKPLPGGDQASLVQLTWEERRMGLVSHESLERFQRGILRPIPGKLNHEMRAICYLAAHLLAEEIENRLAVQDLLDFDPCI